MGTDNVGLAKQMEAPTETHISITDKPHSYEFGKAGARWKLYFNDPAELKKLKEDLEANGFSCEPLEGL